MIEDDILQEIRATRDAFAAAHNDDIGSMVAHLRALDDRGDRPVVRLAPRRMADDDGSHPGLAPSSKGSTNGTGASRPYRSEVGRYVKVVEWSEADGAFVGHCPGIVGPCCRGDDEVEVYRALCGIVAEWVELAVRDGRPLPAATAGMGFASPDRGNPPGS